MKLPTVLRISILKILKNCKGESCLENTKQSKSSLINSGSYLRHLYFTAHARTKIVNNWNLSITSVFMCLNTQ